MTDNHKKSKRSKKFPINFLLFLFNFIFGFIFWGLVSTALGFITLVRGHHITLALIYMFGGCFLLLRGVIARSKPTSGNTDADGILVILTGITTFVSTIYFSVNQNSQLSDHNVSQGTSAGVGDIVAGIKILAGSKRNERLKKEGYCLCPKCSFEQWEGYQSCQKCGHELRG
jgi:hypothetical protein